MPPGCQPDGEQPSRDESSPPWTDPVDEHLAHLILRQVSDDPDIHGRRLRITVQNRVVVIEGGVDSVASKAAASRHAWAASGVADVCNRLVPVG